VVALSPDRDVSTRRSRGALAAIGLALAWAAGLPSAGCSETGPDAPARTNGCLGLDCPPTDDGGRGPSSSSPPDAAAGFGDPLVGTTKRATLVRGRLRFTEGPLWIGGRLLFTDIPANVIYEAFADGGVAQFRTNSGGANGLAIDNQGNLIACEQVRKRVSKSAPAKGSTPSPIANTFGDQPLNAPNDVIVRSDGNIYFTDPNYSGDPTQDDEAVYRIDPEQAVTRLAHDFEKPNGIALSTDGATLYVVDNGSGKLLQAPVDAGGAVGAFSELATVPGGDGMTVDDANNLYVAGDLGIEVFDRGGNKLGTINVDAKPTNCAFGGADRRTLYITANANENDPKTGLYQIVLNVPGMP
jgi:gluconolactonase